MSRKQWLVIKLFILGLILITLSRIGIKIVQQSKSNDENYRINMTNSIPVEEGEKKAFENVEKIVIDSINLPIEIYESDVSEVTIQDNTRVQGVGTREPNKVAYEDGVLSFKQAKQRPLLFSVRGNVVVEVPKGSTLLYKIYSISGDINHDALSTGKLKAETVSGEVNIQQNGEKVSADSVSGSIKIYGDFEEAKAETVSGSICLGANQDTEEISGASVSGSIKIKLDGVTGYEMDYSTISSGVKDSYSNSNYSKSGDVTNGDGSLKIKAQSVSGSITLADWE